MPESAEKLLNELTAAGILSSAEVTQFGREIAVGIEALLDRLVADERITQYQADKFLAGKASDIYFGDYVVQEELGRGGMGTVLSWLGTGGWKEKLRSRSCPSRFSNRKRQLRGSIRK